MDVRVCVHIPALGTQRQEDHKFKCKFTSDQLGYIATPFASTKVPAYISIVEGLPLYSSWNVPQAAPRVQDAEVGGSQVCSSGGTHLACGRMARQSGKKLS